MERCPCCNARLTGAVRCPRCQADLDNVLGSEHWARHWLSNAVRFWFAHEPQVAILALTKSINLKQVSSALVFRDFITLKQGQKVLVLLAEKKYTEAKALLGLLRNLNPNNEFIRQLCRFTDYLLAKEASLHILIGLNGSA